MWDDCDPYAQPYAYCHTYWNAFAHPNAQPIAHAYAYCHAYWNAYSQPDAHHVHRRPDATT